MKNIIKSVIVMLSSISLFASANAGEMTVTGTAKATYNILSGKNQNSGKGLGIANELNFGASGELDNGCTWNYSVALDPGNATGSTNAYEVQNDDSTLTLATNYGTIGVFVSAGGLDVEDGATNSVYARPTDIGDPSATADNYDIGSYNNIQYHTPAGFLPLGIAAKVAYAPGLDGTNNSANAGGGNTVTNGGTVTATTNTTTLGNSATEVSVTAAPIDGLSVGASYMTFSGEGSTTTLKQDAESGAVYAKYASGPFKVGYSLARKAVGIAVTSNGNPVAGVAEWYDQRNMSLAFNVNESLSISYEKETSEVNKVQATDASVEQDSSAIQAAYTMGGMTFAVSLGKYDNNGYTSNNDAEQALFAVTMAF